MLKMEGFPILKARDLDLGSVILRTVVHHSSASTYMPNFSEIAETSFVYVHKHGRMNI